MQSSGYRHLESFESMKIEGAEKCSHKYLLEIIWLVEQHNKQYLGNSTAFGKLKMAFTFCYRDIGFTSLFFNRVVTS